MEYTLDKNRTGITLWTDDASLTQLYDLIHAVVDGSVAIEDREGVVLGLAHDVRKAQSGERRKRQLRQDDHEIRQYGVEILWPVILVQVALLRHAMGLTPTSKRAQATMFELEHVIEEAVHNAMPKDATSVVTWIPRLGSMPYDYLDRVLNSRCVHFINLPPKKRFKDLCNLLETFDPLYDYLSVHQPDILGGIPQSAFDDADSDWPEFDWKKVDLSIFMAYVISGVKDYDDE